MATIKTLKEFFKELVTTQTEEFISINNYDEAYSPKSRQESIDPRIATVRSIFGEMDGDESPDFLRNIARMFAAVLGCSVTDLFVQNEGGESENDTKKVKFALVVPTGNPNGHDYKIGKPAMFISDDGDADDSDMCIKQDGDFGNNMTLSRRHLRPATEEEINEFVNSMDEGHIPSDVKALMRISSKKTKKTKKPVKAGPAIRHLVLEDD